MIVTHAEDAKPGLKLAPLTTELMVTLGSDWLTVNVIATTMGLLVAPVAVMTSPPE